MALNSFQKAVQGSIFYCYQIQLIIAVTKVLESVVILKSAISICLSEANLLSLDISIQKVTVLSHDQTSCLPDCYLL